MTTQTAALWHRRDLVGLLALSKLRRAHRNTMLGYLWWLLDPIIMTAIYTVVVGVLRGGHPLHVPYPAFVMCGLIAWKSFASTQAQSVKSISANRGLVRSFAFPRAVIPVSVVLSNQVLFAFALLPLTALCVFYQVVSGTPGVRVGPALPWLIPVMAVQFVLTLGAALIVSCLGVFFRDLGKLMGHLLRVGYYLSPGLYAVSDVLPGYRGLAYVDWRSARTLYLLNPFAHLVKAYRDCILYGQRPDLVGLGFALVTGLAVLALGLTIFRRREHAFVKWL